MAGAKNTMVIMPDANQDAAIDGVIGSSMGNTGQRCLAGSVAVLVGDTPEWFIPRVVEAAKQIKVSSGGEDGCGMGPLIDEASVARVTQAIERGIEAGADLLLDGRDCDLPGVRWKRFLVQYYRFCELSHLKMRLLSRNAHHMEIWLSCSQTAVMQQTNLKILQERG